MVYHRHMLKHDAHASELVGLEATALAVLMGSYRVRQLERVALSGRNPTRAEKILSLKRSIYSFPILVCIIYAQNV